MDPASSQALIGVIGVVLGVFVTRLFDLFDRREKHKQWRDEFRLPRQLDTLSDLYAATIELNDTIHKLRRTPEVDLGSVDLNLAYTVHEAYNRSQAKAYIYLPELARSIGIRFALASSLAISSTMIWRMQYNGAGEEEIPLEKIKEDRKQTYDLVDRAFTELVSHLQTELSTINIK